MRTAADKLNFTAARKLRSVKQPVSHSRQPDRRLAFDIDAHERVPSGAPRSSCSISRCA
jgi:hypothetical protein